MVLPISLPLYLIRTVFCSPLLPQTPLQPWMGTMVHRRPANVLARALTPWGGGGRGMLATSEMEKPVALKHCGERGARGHSD